MPTSEGPGEAERARWLRSLAAACERVLDRQEPDAADPASTWIRHDVEALLARVTAELDELG